MGVIALTLFILALSVHAATPSGGRADLGASPLAGVRLAPDGTPVDPAFFPIAVWLQDPRNASRYRAAGFNLYVGLWKGPTEAQLTALRSANMPVFCEANDVARAHRADPIIAGWMHGDEPDNAQEVTDPKTGKRSWGSPIPPARIVADYERRRIADPTRPVMLNLGQGVANDEWKGRGNGARLDDYQGYVRGGDIISFDVYPVAGLGKPESLWYVAKGLDRLRHWTNGKKTIWNCIESTRIGGEGKPNPHQVRAEVWMSLIHGSRGLIYFVHQFKPSFDEHALLDDPEMLAAVTAINRQIRELAPVLNSPSVAGGVTVISSVPGAPIDAVVKRRGGAVYVFAAAMRHTRATASFDLRGATGGSEATVLGEGRVIRVQDGRFADSFDPDDVHLYEIR
ncbi:MAG: hypothetical protein ACYDH9_25215 [Limisphaerales bacterium]